MPIFGIVFTWRFFGLVYTNNLELSEFQKSTGTVTNIWIAAEKTIGRFSRTEHNLKIKLSNNEHEFRIYNRFKYRFDELFEKLPIGTTATIYHLSDNEAMLSKLKPADLYRIDSKGETLFKFEWMKYKRTRDMNTFAFITIACWTAYGIYMYQDRAKKKKSVQ
jgi:hypothetical protein